MFEHVGSFTLVRVPARVRRPKLSKCVHPRASLRAKDEKIGKRSAGAIETIVV